MKLYSKLTLFNAVSKILILLVLILFVPPIANRVVLNHVDERLTVIKQKILNTVDRVGITKFIKEEEDSSFSSYNILKEEFISIEQVPDTVTVTEQIENTQRNIENVIVNYRVLSFVFVKSKKKYLLEIGRSLFNIEQLIFIFKKFTFYILIVILLVTVLIDVWFTKLLLRPFQWIIEKKLKTVKYPADFNFQKLITSTTDFRYLDKSINRMMMKISNAFLQEKEFTSNVSHELLTPISILQSRIENILSDTALPDNVVEKILESQKTLTRLKKIITTLLMISRIEHEQYIKEDTVSIRQLIAEVIDEIEERLSEKKIQLDFNCSENFTFSQCNKSLLFTLFFNLINNAIRYNVPSGKVVIFSANKNGKFSVEIKDTGVGMDAEKIKTLFDRFRKQKNSDEESHGLGIPIVKAVADFHKIDIQITSQPGRGSSFCLIFP